MALYSVNQGGVQLAGDVQQYFNLLTGVMSDQQVTVSNRIRAQMTGATAASGYVGGHSGPPVSGTFAAGDYVADGTNGALWMCTGAGTPGTWQGVGQSLISSQTLGAAASSVTFSSIPQVFRHLMLTVTARSAAATTNDNVLYRLNADTGANYYRGDWSVVSGASGTVGFNVSNATSGIMTPIYGTTVADSRASGSGVIFLPDYTNTTYVKTTIAMGGDIIGTGGYAQAYRVSGWFVANAVTTIQLLLSSGGNFNNPSTFNLYGIP